MVRETAQQDVNEQVLAILQIHDTVLRDLERHLSHLQSSVHSLWGALNEERDKVRMLVRAINELRVTLREDGKGSGDTS